MDLQHPRKPSAADIAASIRRSIAAGTHAPGDRLPPERRMAESYGVARGTVREALLRLEREDYVEIRAGSGTYITWQPPRTQPSAIEQANPLELIDTRFALEPHICRLAVLHARRDDLERLDGLCDVMEGANNDPVAFADADTDFHAALVHSTGNGLLVWIIDQINSVRGQDEWTKMRHLTLEDAIIARYNREHRAIVAAIREREPERAATAMKNHLETARLSLTRAAAT